MTPTRCPVLLVLPFVHRHPGRPQGWARRRFQWQHGDNYFSADRMNIKADVDQPSRSLRLHVCQGVRLIRFMNDDDVSIVVDISSRRACPWYGRSLLRLAEPACKRKLHLLHLAQREHVRHV